MTAILPFSRCWPLSPGRTCTILCASLRTDVKDSLKKMAIWAITPDDNCLDASCCAAVLNWATFNAIFCERTWRWGCGGCLATSSPILMSYRTYCDISSARVACIWKIVIKWSDVVVGQCWFQSSRRWCWYFAGSFSLVPADEEFLSLLEVVPETDAHAWSVSSSRYWQDGDCFDYRLEGAPLISFRWDILLRLIL